MPSSPELYRRVVQEGRRRRLARRRRFGASGAAALVIVVTAVGALAQVGAPDGHPTAVTTSTALSTSEATTTVAPATENPTTSGAPSTTAPRTTLAPTTTVLVCRNNRTNPECGPFYYDPPYVNQPLTGSLRLSEPTPRAGTPVTLTIEATDPDASISLQCFDPSYTTDQALLGMGCARPAAGCAASLSPRFGPWDPPRPAEGGSVVRSVTLTFENPGPHQINVNIASNSSTCAYADAIDLTLEVTVT